MNRHSGTPKLLPGTFYAACQSCGRTFLGLLTAWPAALLPAFAAFLLLTSGNAYAQDSVESDRAVLVALYNATDGPNWTDNTHWLSNEPLSEWHGVGINDDGRVTELDLGRNQLTGEIPVKLGNLAQLWWLYLSYNQLTGEIPVELGQLTHLTDLNLGRNQLTGEIPVELGQLSQLQYLNLGRNQLTGEIPVELGQLTQLGWLYLHSNELNGPIPPELENLTQLQVFDIRNTGLCVTANSELHTWIATIQDFQGTATCQLVLDFAHFANGAAIVSDLVFINIGTAPTRPALYFYDQAGAPIAAESVVDVLGDLVVREDGALSVQTELASLGELTISTHGRGEVVSGSVKVVSDGPIGGVLRFGLPGIGVAGVGASQPVRDAIFPARRQAGEISTAAAVHNLGEEAMVVSCQLMKGGAVLEEVEIPLAANGQKARFIEKVFTRTDTSDFVGSVRCTATGLFTGVAVELDAANRIFTTLPVVPVEERMDRE